MNDWEMTETEALAARMRAARAIASKSQEVVAAAIGISRPTLSKWERGKSPIPPLMKAGVIAAYAKATGQPESFFTEGEVK